MSHSAYRTLIDRGRKAGLHTGELYQALSGQRPPEGVQSSGQADGNGFVASNSNADGRTIYRPLTYYPRP